MKCPVCKNRQQVNINLKTDSFKEGITECRVCGAVWSVSHGVTEIVRDPQVKSFLEAQSESVEGDDYPLPGDDEKNRVS